VAKTADNVLRIRFSILIPYIILVSLIQWTSPYLNGLI
jgi:hypothetical protein